MAKGRATLEWDQTSLLWCQVANANRDPKETPKPYLPSVVHPYRKEEDYRPDDRDRRKQDIDTIKKTCRLKKLRNGSIRNIGGKSLPAITDR